MFRTIDIGKEKVDLLANAATNIYFKQTFHEDLLEQFSKSKKDVFIATDKVPELAYIMATQAKGSTKPKDFSYEAYLAWLNQFEALDIYYASGEIFDVYMGTNETDSEAKKNEDKQKE